jgi:hypothetical protein
MSRHLLMAHRTGHDEDESEPVVINTDNPRFVVIELDDGDRLELDPRELLAAVDAGRKAA